MNLSAAWCGGGRGGAPSGDKEPCLALAGAVPVPKGRGRPGSAGV